MISYTNPRAWTWNKCVPQRAFVFLQWLNPSLPLLEEPKNKKERKWEEKKHPCPGTSAKHTTVYQLSFVNLIESDNCFTYIYIYISLAFSYSMIKKDDLFSVFFWLTTNSWTILIRNWLYLITVPKFILVNVFFSQMKKTEKRSFFLIME